MDIESEFISAMFLFVNLSLVVDTFSQLGQNSKARRIVAVKLSLRIIDSLRINAMRRGSRKITWNKQGSHTAQVESFRLGVKI